MALRIRVSASVGLELEGEDVAETLVNFASARNVRHAFFGKSRLTPLRERLRGSFILNFLYDAVGVDVSYRQSDSQRGLMRKSRIFLCELCPQAEM